MNATARTATNARNARRAEIIAAYEAAEESMSRANNRVESALCAADRAEKVAALVRAGGTPSESVMGDLHDAAHKAIGWRAYDLTPADALPYYLDAVSARTTAANAAQDAARAALKTAEKAYNRLRF